jgi:hypothetical protein
MQGLYSVLILPLKQAEYLSVNRDSRYCAFHQFKACVLLADPLYSPVVTSFNECLGVALASDSVFYCC